MKLSKVPFTESDFLRVRDFLVATYKDPLGQKNWFIDRWNFCRYFAQSMHNTFETWPDTVGMWTDEENKIVAVVNSEGENRGETFFQLGAIEFSDDLLNEFLDHAESNFRAVKGSGEFINLRVNQGADHLKGILTQRGYQLQNGNEPTASLMISQGCDVIMPDGFQVVDGTALTNYQSGLAHGRAFGYYQGDQPDDEDAEKAYAATRTAPDYKQTLDLAIVDANDDVASFTTVWYDASNQIGVLEPVGTIPKYRKMGLGRAVIYEGMNRIGKLGATKMYVGSDQQFYRAIGFCVEYAKEMWQKIW